MTAWQYDNTERYHGVSVWWEHVTAWKVPLDYPIGFMWLSESIALDKALYSTRNCYIFLISPQKHMSQLTTKPTIRPVWLAKTQISLYIHPVWQGFLFIPLRIAQRLLKKAHEQWRLWSDCTDGHADLSLHWSHKVYCWFCCALTHCWYSALTSVGGKGLNCLLFFQDSLQHFSPFGFIIFNFHVRWLLL